MKRLINVYLLSRSSRAKGNFYSDFKYFVAKTTGIVKTRGVPSLGSFHYSFENTSPILLNDVISVHFFDHVIRLELFYFI